MVSALGAEHAVAEARGAPGRLAVVLCWTIWVGLAPVYFTLSGFAARVLLLTLLYPLRVQLGIKEQTTIVSNQQVQENRASCW